MAILIFKPSTQLTFATVEDDRKRLLDCCNRADSDGICVDLSEVSLCDSAGMALLIESKRLCMEHNKACEITGMTQAIRSLAEFCGVRDIVS